MRRFGTGALVACALVACTGVAAAESAHKTAEHVWKAYAAGFTARMVGVTTNKDDGKVKSTMEAMFFFSPKKMRMDLDLGKAREEGKKNKSEDDAHGMKQSSTITDMEKQVVYILLPDSKMYMTQDFSKAAKKNKAPRQDWFGRENIQFEELGAETAAGHPCRKVKASWEDTVDGKTTTGSALMWLAKDMDEFPVQVQPQNDDDEQVTITYNDVKRGAPPASTFEIPSDYKKFSIGGMFKGGSRPGGDDKGEKVEEAKDDDKDKAKDDDGGLGGFLKKKIKK